MGYITADGYMVGEILPNPKSWFGLMYTGKYPALMPSYIPSILAIWNVVSCPMITCEFSNGNEIPRVSNARNSISLFFSAGRRTPHYVINSASNTQIMAVR